MSIIIKNVRSATFNEWDQIWENCNYATYFQSREWAEIWQVYTHNRTKLEPLLITFSDNQKALLPFSCQKIYQGLIKQYISSLAGTFGGWISIDNLTLEHTLLLENYLQTKISNLYWRVNPYTPYIDQINLISSQDDSTYVLNLQEGFDHLSQNWKRGNSSTERKVRKARKEGVIIKSADRIDEWQTYYQIYQDSLQRWGENLANGYRWELFDKIWQRHSSQIKLWLAIYNNQIIAGALVFYAQYHVVYWHGAALEAYFQLRPVNLLMYEIIKNACEKDYLWFDFNPSSGLEGVKAFKRSFGTQELASPVIHKNSPICLMLNHIKSLIKS